MSDRARDVAYLTCPKCGKHVDRCQCAVECLFCGAGFVGRRAHHDHICGIRDLVLHELFGWIAPEYLPEEIA